MYDVIVYVHKRYGAILPMYNLLQLFYHSIAHESMLCAFNVSLHLLFFHSSLSLLLAPSH